MAKRNVIHIHMFTNQAETGLWCDLCMTSGGFRIPMASPSGMSYATGCLTCRRGRENH